MPITQSRLSATLGAAEAYAQAYEGVRSAAREIYGNADMSDRQKFEALYLALFAFAPSQAIAELMVREKLHFELTHRRNARNARRQAKLRARRHADALDDAEADEA